ncbi:MAG: GntR family transcriptional regulator [Pseudomonadota bacterium]
MPNQAARLRDALEEEIVMGRLAPGMRLEEPALAARFGVSRTPIREALLQLAAAGLIDTGPRRGAQVSRVSVHRLVQMFEVMAELEAMCARLAARRAGPEDLAALRTAHAACADASAHSDDTYYYENETFHEVIRAASGQGFLVEHAGALQRRLKPYRRLQLRVRGRRSTSLAEHGAIVSAIEAGDSAAAEAAMRSHVIVQGERFSDLVATLETRQQPQAS